MSYQVAWFTGSRIIKHGTMYIKPVMHMLKNKLSDCRPDSTKSVIKNTNITFNIGFDGHLHFSVMSTFAYFILKLTDARMKNKQMTEQELQIAQKNDVEHIKLQEQKCEVQNAKEPQSSDDAKYRKDQETNEEPMETEDIAQKKESEHAQLHEKQCEAKKVKEQQHLDGANNRKDTATSMETRKTNDITRKEAIVRVMYATTMKLKRDPFFESTFKEI